ncbi:MAG: hypothetical protein JSV40_03940 [Deltaproteobacteria bacterium]|nr:MAG: hypothetical protein JSV40_03940 [Deltaproteobacteria bacterium]
MFRQTIKSAVLVTLFLLVVLSATSVYAQFGVMTQQPPQESEKAVLSSATGRYVFGQVSDSDQDQFMLDTATGRLWRLTKRSDIGVCLSTVPYRSAEGECSPLPESMPVSEAGEAKKQ